jgi:hypothetical protein
MSVQISGDGKGRMRYPRRYPSSYWKDQVLKFERSGLSAKAFCDQESLGLSTFFRWRRHLKESGGEETFIPLEEVFQEEPEAPPPVSKMPPCIGAPKSFKLFLKKGFYLEIPEDFSSMTLCKIVSALSGGLDGSVS